MNPVKTSPYAPKKYIHSQDRVYLLGRERVMVRTNRTCCGSGTHFHVLDEKGKHLCRLPLNYFVASQETRELCVAISDKGYPYAMTVDGYVGVCSLCKKLYLRRIGLRNKTGVHLEGFTLKEG